MTKLMALPKLAVLAISAGIVVVGGGATYAAAVNWFGAGVSTNQQNNKIYTVATDCSPSLVQALQGNSKHTNTTEYKILKPELISETDLKNDELVTCEVRAIEDGLRQAAPELYLAGDSHNGLYYPVGNYGTVVAVKGSTVTVANVPVGHTTAEREIVTTTLTLQPKTVITDKGAKTTLATFKPGDNVYFILQNPVATGEDYSALHAAPSAKSTIRAFAKTQYDHRIITEKVEHAARQNAFLILNKSDAYGG